MAKVTIKKDTSDYAMVAEIIAKILDESNLPSDELQSWLGKKSKRTTEQIREMIRARYSLITETNDDPFIPPGSSA